MSVAKQSVKKKPFQPGKHLDLILLAVVGVVVIVLAFLYQSSHTDGFNLDVKNPEDSSAVAEIYAADAVRINEIMSANDSALFTEAGETADWIELINTGSSPVNLAGYSLEKQAGDSKQFVFPEQILSSGESVIVFCDNKNRNTAGYEYHAPFGISRAGDTLLLFNPKGTAVDSVNIPELSENQVYARTGSDSWDVSYDFTPGLGNTPENHLSFEQIAADSPVEITEIMAKNVTYAPDNGMYYDYIELHNKTGETVDLSGWHLSDDRNSVGKWTFPAGTTIGPGEYLLVYASGLNQSSGSLHASFKLSTEGETVVLSNRRGQLLDQAEYPLLGADQSYSKDSSGSFTTNLPPTPGMANTNESAALIADRFAAQNGIGVFLTEIAASTTELKYDWIELYNASSQTVDLSGFGLTDAADKPRKWLFPEGTVIAPGSYLGVYASGLTDQTGAVPHANFRLAAEGGYEVCLATPEGAVFDRIYLPRQFSNLSYGRLSGQYGRCYYFTDSTPLAENNGTYYARKASEARYSVPGGLFDEGEVVTLELSAEPGDYIYYTTDCTDPTQASNLYTGPITITSDTIVRTRVYSSDALESYMSCQSYLFGLSHTVKVVSLVSDPEGLISEETGILVKGPNASPKHPYTGANFWQDWERECHVELFEPGGGQLLSQECGMKLQGQYSRAEDQKAFKLYARSQYSGSNVFPVALFSNRPYTEYDSFLLRSSGQDTDKIRMRDSILTSLAKDTSVFYQETEVCVVYLNGQYWGHYNIREHVNTYSICQYEGWDGQEDAVDLVKANTNVFQGSNETFEQLLSWIKSNDVTTDSAYETIGSVIDIRNFIEYMSIEIFTGNTDTLNVKRYRNALADGKWRWVLFDLDWAFVTDTDSISRWLTPGGMGNGRRTDNSLFIACMKNPRFREEFLTYFGQQLATTFSTRHIAQLAAERSAILEPELPMQAAKWGPDLSTYNAQMKSFLKYAKERPKKLLGYFQKALNLSEDDLWKYFGDAYREMQAYAEETKGS